MTAAKERYTTPPSSGLAPLQRLLQHAAAPAVGGGADRAPKTSEQVLATLADGLDSPNASSYDAVLVSERYAAMETAAVCVPAPVAARRTIGKSRNHRAVGRGAQLRDAYLEHTHWSTGHWVRVRALSSTCSAHQVRLLSHWFAQRLALSEGCWPPRARQPLQPRPRSSDVAGQNAASGGARPWVQHPGARAGFCMAAQAKPAPAPAHYRPQGLTVAAQAKPARPAS